MRSDTSSTEGKRPLKKHKKSAEAVLTLVERQRSAGSPASEASTQRQASADAKENTSTSTQAEEAKRFREEVAHHCAELRRRDDVSGSPHSRLAAAIVAMFEFDAPALKEAVISTLRDPDPQTAISPDQFFATHLGDGATVTPFDDILHTINSASRDVVTTQGVERLIKDVQVFHDLVDACQASPYDKIRAASSSYIAKATHAFVQQALAVTPEQQAPDAEVLQPLLDHLKANPDTEAALDLLGFACDGQFSAEIRKAFHVFGLGIAAHLPNSEQKLDLIATNFAATVPGLPVDHQLRAFRNCVSLDADAPVDAARHLLRSCSDLIDQFNHEVGGKAAIELVKAAGQYGDPKALESVLCRIEHFLIRGNPYSNVGKSYFDSVPENDRIGYFVSAIHAALDMPGFDRRWAASLGLQIVDKVLPDRMIDLAKDALWEVDQGKNVDFRSKAQDWQA